MTKKLQVICHESCDNAPRKEILRDITIAFVSKDLDHVQEWLSDNIVWNNIGNDRLIGKEKVLENIPNLWGENAMELFIDYIITHGRTASLNGQIKYGNSRALAFCNIFEFVSAGKNSKIKEITSYRIHLEKS